MNKPALTLKTEKGQDSIVYSSYNHIKKFRKSVLIILFYCLNMFHHPIHNKRQEIGKEVPKQDAIPAVEMGDELPWDDPGPSEPNHEAELSSSLSTDTAVNCKCTFDVVGTSHHLYLYSFYIFYDSFKLHFVGYFCCFCAFIIPALAALQGIFPEWDLTTLKDILQRCGGVVADAVDMVFAEVPPMNVCNVSLSAKPGNYNLWYCNYL